MFHNTAYSHGTALFDLSQALFGVAMLPASAPGRTEIRKRAHPHAVHP